MTLEIHEPHESREEKMIKLLETENQTLAQALINLTIRIEELEK